MQATSLNFIPYPWQATQWLRLREAVDSGRVPHALLLHGPLGVGKHHFARGICHLLLCAQASKAGGACGTCNSCQWLRAQNHPDLIWLSAPEKGHAMKVDDIRDVLAEVVLTRHQQTPRVVVLEAADTLNAAAANALLKTLEEPPTQLIFILISHDPARLPITLRSRCVALKFNPVPAAQAMTWVHDRIQAMRTSLNHSQLELLLKLSHGAPLQVCDWIENGMAQHILSFYDNLTGLLNAKTTVAACAAQASTKLDLPLLLRTLMAWIALRSYDLAHKLQLPLQSFYHWDKVMEWQQALHQGISLNAKLQLEALLYEIVQQETAQHG